MGSGGGGSQVIQPNIPPPPSPEKMMKAWRKELPHIYTTQLAFAPKQAKMQVDIAEQEAQRFGAAMQQAQEAMYPGITAMRDVLTQQSLEGMQGDMPEWMRKEYLSGLRANLGTNIGSPIGADYTSRAMLGAKHQYQNYYRNLALNLTGRQPLASPQVPSYTDQVSSFTPQSVMNYYGQTYPAYAQASVPFVGYQPSATPGIMGAGMNLLGTIMGGMF